MEAWLTFLSSDDPERIVQLVNTYPEFLDCYQDIVKFRIHPKELITMYSEALLILDRNTSQLMIEDMQATIENLRELAAQKDDTITAMGSAIAQKDDAIAQKDGTIAEMGSAIAQKDDTITQKDAEISALQAELALLKKQTP